MSLIRRLAYVLLVLLAACGGVPRQEIRQAVANLVEAEHAPDFVRDVRWKTVQDLYASRDNEPVWLKGDSPRGQARDLVAAVAGAEREGFRLSEYDIGGLQSALTAIYEEDGQTPEALAGLELRFTTLYLQYGHDMLAGRLDPSVVNRGWYVTTRRQAADSILLAALADDDFRDVMKSLRPNQEQYQALREALTRYRAAADAGGWPEVGTATLKPGATGDRVLRLRQRLAATGDLDSSHVDGPATLDDDLQEAVDRFRARHGLDAAPGVDRATLAALNVPVDQRVRQIELNLDRLRWVPSEFGPRYVLVNIPEYQLRAFDGGKEVLTMKVVVGKDYENATPVFADTMSEVVFHPDWNIPRDITTQEIIPLVRESREYLRDRGYEVIDLDDPNRVVDPKDIDWDADTADFRFRIRQPGGDGNALGKVKFMFPNRFSIYMHDTPTRSTFERTNRAASHGCVRLEDPVAFAKYVLDPQGGWDEDRIRTAMNDTVTKVVHLEHGLPVYLLYLTAYPQDGTVQFRADVYGTDRAALARLGSPAPDRSIEPLRKQLVKLAKG